MESHANFSEEIQENVAPRTLREIERTGQYRTFLEDYIHHRTILRESKESAIGHALWAVGYKI